MFLVLAVVAFIFILFFISAFLVRTNGRLALSLLVIPFLLIGGFGGILWSNYKYETLGLIYYFFPPKDIHTPVIIEPFSLGNVGFSKTYDFSPRYLNSYQIGYFVEGENLSSEDQFSGKLRVDLLLDGQVVLTREVSSTEGGLYAEMNGDEMMYKSFYLLRFNIPPKMMKKEFRNNIRIRITVLDSDEDLKKFGDSLKGFVSVKTLP